MADSRSPLAPPRLTFAKWLICVIAALGFAFDTYELMTLPLIIRPALQELGGLRPGTPEFSFWLGLFFYLPATCGGVFGLLSGYLTDLLGRRRVLIWSILAYACASFASGFSTSLAMLLILRCLVFIAVCSEYVASVAWLAEFFPDDRQREGVLGAAQVFSSLGGVMVAVTNGLCAAWALHQPYPLLFGLSLPPLRLPAIQLPTALSFLGTIAQPHADWRYTLISGLLPAIPLLLARPFMPESPQWQRKRNAGLLKRPNVLELFQPALRRTTLLATMMVACAFAALYGAIMQMPQVVPGLPDVRVETAKAVAAIELSAVKTGVEDASEEAKAAQARKIAAAVEHMNAARLTKIQELGGGAGRLAMVGLALLVVSRRSLLRLLLVPGLLVVPLTFALAGKASLSWIDYGIFLAGFLTLAQFSFWGNYLPRVFPLHLRGTGESFAVNVGGRMIGTSFAVVTHWIAVWLPLSASYAFKVAYVACGVGFATYMICFWATFWLPEPKPGALAD